jgi:hypothetical protein
MQSFTRRNIVSKSLLMMAKGPPAEPINFAKKFSLPISNEKLILEEINAHPMDARIEFESVAHEYFLDGISMDFSVTQLVEEFFEKFDADEVIRKMMNGNRWPREGYITKDGAPYNEMQIKKKWDDIGEYARNRGTWMHYNIERYLNDLEPSPTLEEMDKFVAFYTDVIKGKNIQPTRTEWRIAAPKERIAGSVDFVGRFEDGTYAILDWKRSKDLQGGLTNKFGKRCAYPIDYLDDCDGSKYFLQLNMYRYILETYYDLKVSYMGVASFHPNLDSYYLAQAPEMTKECMAMIDDIIRRRAEGEIFPRAKLPPKPVAAQVTPRNEERWMDQTADQGQGQRQQPKQWQAPQPPQPPQWQPQPQQQQQPAYAPQPPQPPRTVRSGTGAMAPPASTQFDDIPF